MNREFNIEKVMAVEVRRLIQQQMMTSLWDDLLPDPGPVLSISRGVLYCKHASVYRSVSPASLSTRMYDALYALHCKRSIRLLAATPYSGRNPDQDVARSQCTDRALDAIDDTLHGLQKILVLSLTPRLPHYRHNKTTVRGRGFWIFSHFHIEPLHWSFHVMYQISNT